MARVLYVQPDGTETTAELADGTSVMQGAFQRGIPGIRAECGGGCACATCHVYVDEEWAAILPAADSFESEMLAAVAAERCPTSRLSCQIVAVPALDGLIVHLPEAQ